MWISAYVSLNVVPFPPFYVLAPKKVKLMMRHGKGIENYLIDLLKFDMNLETSLELERIYIYIKNSICAAENAT